MQYGMSPTPTRGNCTPSGGPQCLAEISAPGWQLCTMLQKHNRHTSEKRKVGFEMFHMARLPATMNWDHGWHDMWHMKITSVGPCVVLHERSSCKRRTWGDSCLQLCGFWCPSHRGCPPTNVPQLCCSLWSSLYARCSDYRTTETTGVLYLTSSSSSSSSAAAAALWHVLHLISEREHSLTLYNWTHLVGLLWTFCYTDKPDWST